MKRNKTKKTTPKTHNTIKNCSFYGVKWDEAAIDTVSKIADGLIENARGFGKLAEVLKASNVSIDAMLKIDASKTEPSL